MWVRLCVIHSVISWNFLKVDVEIIFRQGRAQINLNVRYTNLVAQQHDVALLNEKEKRKISMQLNNCKVCRTILGFWAGHRNSKIRVNLAKAWEKDPVLFITNNRISRAVGEFVYQKQFLRSKFCICPAGSQVNSARIAEALHYGCVPCKFLL